MATSTEFAPPSAVEDLSNMTPVQRRLLELKMKLNKARKDNHSALVSEKKRAAEGPEAAKKKAAENYREMRERKKKEAEELGQAPENPLLSETLEVADNKVRKKRKKEENQAAFGWEVFNQDTLLKAHEKRIARSVKVDLEAYERQKKETPDFYRSADNMAYGAAPVADKAKVDNMVLDLVDAMDRRNKFSRRRTHHEEADVDYINDRNAHFNRKIERAFGAFTKEIKENLERGTAL
mmetsp:Transcript_50246/g.109212  ORF Transcript_50246/g.109212 Transcript_50246/m.109212 type:complete len:237 (+) Transcript_50246:27-737(+)